MCSMGGSLIEPDIIEVQYMCMVQNRGTRSLYEREMAFSEDSELRVNSSEST